MKHNGRMAATLLMAISFVVAINTPTSAAVVTLDHVDGQLGPDQIVSGVSLNFVFRVENFLGTSVITFENGFRVYSPDGALWQPITYNFVSSLDWSAMFDGIFLNPHGITGMGADTIGFGGVAIFASGWPDGFSEDVWQISTQVDPADNGRHLCVDSSYYPPSGGWVWGTSSGSAIPQWDGPHCFEIVANQPQQITNGVPDILGFHCDVMVFDFDAYDPEGDPYWFEIVSGPGTIDTVSGFWTFTPTPGDIGMHTLEVRACGPFGCGDIWHTNIMVLNQAPIFVSGCDDTLYTAPGSVLLHQLVATDPDPCDPLNSSSHQTRPTPD